MEDFHLCLDDKIAIQLLHQDKAIAATSPQTEPVEQGLSPEPVPMDDSTSQE